MVSGYTVKTQDGRKYRLPMCRRTTGLRDRRHFLGLLVGTLSPSIFPPPLHSMDSYRPIQNPPSSSTLPSNDQDDILDPDSMKAPKRKRLAKVVISPRFLSCNTFNFHPRPVMLATKASAAVMELVCTQFLTSLNRS
jgi:hypothetical protein